MLTLPFLRRNHQFDAYRTTQYLDAKLPWRKVHEFYEPDILQQQNNVFSIFVNKLIFFGNQTKQFYFLENKPAAWFKQVTNMYAITRFIIPMILVPKREITFHRKIIKYSVPLNFLATIFNRHHPTDLSQTR